MVSKTERARQLALEGKSRSEIMEQVPCSKTTAFNALKWAEAQKPPEARPPSIEVTEEEAKPEFVVEAEAPEEVVEEEVAPPEVPEIPVTFDKETVWNFFDAMFGKDTWGDYGMDTGKTKALANLWEPIFIKHWEKIVTTWGIEIMAVVGTLFIVGGHIRAVRKVQRERKPKKEMP